MNLIKLIKILCTSKYTPYIYVISVRIAAANPHSDNPERFINPSALLKSSLRMTITVEWKDFYLYIHYNMLPLYGLHPRGTVHY